MARKTAADLNLFEEEDEIAIPALPVPESDTPKPRKRQTNKATDLQSLEVTVENIKLTESVSLADVESVSNELPKYLQLERKEVRLRLDQLDELTALTRRLNHARRG